MLQSVNNVRAVFYKFGTSWGRIDEIDGGHDLAARGCREPSCDRASCILSRLFVFFSGAWLPEGRCRSAAVAVLLPRARSVTIVAAGSPRGDVGLAPSAVDWLPPRLPRGEAVPSEGGEVGILRAFGFPFNSSICHLPGAMLHDAVTEA